jgi:nucleoside-diphosphate-sugar epimerase
MSEEEIIKKAKTTEMKRVLVFGGKTGWIGNLMCELLEKEGKKIKGIGRRRGYSVQCAV